MNNFTEVLKKHNLKATPQRISILETIYKYGHINIDTLYIEIKNIFSSVSQATIYKNINIMINSMLLLEVKLPNEKSVYEITKENHSHLLCSKCKNTIDIAVSTENIIGKISQEHNFQIQRSDLVFSGICNKCLDL